jgi:hypothetical protein
VSVIAEGIHGEVDERKEHNTNTRTQIRLYSLAQTTNSIELQDDKGSIATTPNILPPPYVLKLGQLCFEVPPEDDVNPNFRTPPMMFHVRQGAAAKDI